MGEKRRQEDTQTTRVMDMRPFVMPNGVESLEEALCRLVNAANASKASKKNPHNSPEIEDGDVIRVEVGVCLKNGKSMDAQMSGLPVYRIAIGREGMSAEPCFEGEEARVEYIRNFGELPVYVGDLIHGAKKGDDDGDYVYFNVGLIFAGKVEYEKKEGVEGAADAEAEDFFSSLGKKGEPKPGTAEREKAIERDLATRFNEFFGGGNSSGNNGSNETKTNGSGIRRVRRFGDLPPEVAAQIAPQDTYGA